MRSACRRKGSGACRGRWVGCSGVSHQVDGPLGGRLRRQSPFARKKLESYARALGERRPRLRAWQRAEGAVRIEVGKTLCARSCVHRAGRRYCSVVEHFVPYYRRRCCQFSNDQGWSRWQFDAVWMLAGRSCARRNRRSPETDTRTWELGAMALHLTGTFSARLVFVQTRDGVYGRPGASAKPKSGTDLRISGSSRRCQ